MHSKIIFKHGCWEICLLASRTGHGFVQLNYCMTTQSKVICWPPLVNWCLRHVHKTSQHCFWLKYHNRQLQHLQSSQCWFSECSWIFPPGWSSCPFKKKKTHLGYSIGHFILKLNISMHKESEEGATSALVWMKVVVCSNNAFSVKK